MKRFFQQLLNDLRNTSDSGTQDRSDHHSLELAASVILLETAAMDDDLASSELTEITEILRHHFNLSHGEVDELIEAAENIRNQAIDLYQFTQIINESSSRTQKIQLMEYVWQVIYADGRLDQHEDYLVHKLARLLHIDHKDFIAAKLKAREASGQSPVQNKLADSPTDT